MAKRIGTVFIAAGALLLAAGCAPRNPHALARIDGHETERVWKASKTPEPLGALTMIPGDERRIGLRGAVSGGSARVQSARYAVGSVEILSLSFVPGDEEITVRAVPGKGGEGVLLLQALTPRGEPAELAVPYMAAFHPVITFAYRPPTGTKPQHVFVAGAFNGWSSARHELLDGGNGVYTLDLPIPPGNWPYKFVVDGEWMADPANPKRESGGHGNSLLEVEGVSADALTFSLLSSAMPGSGAQGAIALASGFDEPLDPARVHLVVNNVLAPPQWWSLDAAGQTVRLAIPPDQWLDENFIVLLASDTAGRTGIFQSRADLPGAPRSPRDEVIYFAMTDRFLDGDPSNNPVHTETEEELHPLARYHGGDWQGITAKIGEGYFDKLGVTSIWLSPANRNTDRIEQDALPPHRRFSSYHAYWPTSLDETNPPFGTARELATLVDNAHEHDIAILLDYVANHVHETHPLVTEHPGWVTDMHTPDGRLNIRLFDEYPFTTWFDNFLPTLEYHDNPVLVQAMVENAAYWLDTTGADGFRLDAVKHVDPAYWSALSSELYERYTLARGENIYTVGETISDRSTINKFVGPGLLTGQFDFPLLFALQGPLGRGEGSLADAAKAVLASQEEYPAAGVMSPLLGNHDVVRFMALVDGDMPPGVDEKEVGFTNPPRVDRADSYARMRAAFAFLFSVPGPPTLYYGDEIGMTGAHDPDNRRSMRWQDWSAEETATFDAVSQLAHARHASVALRRGRYEVVEAGENHLVAARVSPEETVLIALKTAPGALTIELPAAWGSPVALEPVVDGGLQASLAGESVELSGPSQAYGYWRVRW